MAQQAHHAHMMSQQSPPPPVGDQGHEHSQHPLEGIEQNLMPKMDQIDEPAIESTPKRPRIEPIDDSIVGTENI